MPVHFNQIIIESGFNSITVDQFRRELLKKGKALLNHIHRVQEIGSNGSVELKALCNASMDVSMV